MSALALIVALAPLACLTLFLATVSAVASPSASTVATQAGATTQSVIPLSASFNSVELRNGGKVNLIHGQTQRVTLVRGDPASIDITVRDDGRLVIDRCPNRCEHRQGLEVDVVTPALTAIEVAEGGTIQSRSEFPSQPNIELDVSQGGMIDVRSMAAASVTASVYSGGRIFVKPTTTLAGTVEQGGIITYWGDPKVTSSVRNSAGVVQGKAADADKPLEEFDPTIHSPVPSVPAVPAVPSVPAVPAVEAARPEVRTTSS